MSQKNIWVELKEKHGLARILVDLFMILVVMVNLTFIIFDWHFQFAFFQNFLIGFSSDFYYWYKIDIHPNFLLYDLFFVIIFITELLISWIIDARNKTHSRWWFYPFIHWYDVIGCIPVGVFRWLRMFRIVSMLLKMHNLGVINLKENIIYRNVKELYTMFTNKVTDKVLVNLVSGIQRAVEVEKTDGKGSDKNGYIADAVKPDQEELAKVLVAKIQRSAKNNYNNHKDELKETIYTVVKEAFEQSDELKKIEQLPIVGKQITQTLEKSLSDIAFQLVDSSLKQLTSTDTGKLMEESFNTTIDAVLDGENHEDFRDEKEEELNRIIRNILGRILERVKNDIGKKNVDDPF
jgi:hypothetical protein